MHRRRLISAVAVAAAAIGLVMPSAAAGTAGPARPVHPAKGVFAALAGKAAHAKATIGAPITDHTRLAYSLRDDAGLTTVGQTVRAHRDARGRVIVVVETKQASVVSTEVAAARGKVLVTVPGLVKAAVPAASLASLSTQAGVDAVREPIAFRPATIDSQGVSETTANTWQSASRNGSGQRVAIVDGGFTGYAAAETAGELPAAADVTPVNTWCDTAAAGADHGTAVAEIVHDMAPAAKLVLICIQDDVDFAAASHLLATDAAYSDVKVANLSGGFPAAGRGDGSGAAGSPAAAVKESRAAGVLWTVSAGNEGLTHYGFTYRDGDKDNIADVRSSCWLGSPADCFRGTGLDDYEYVPVAVAAGQVGEFTLQWDAWPTTTQDFNFYAYLVSGSSLPLAAQSVTNQHASAGPPVEDLVINNSASATDNVYLLVVRKSSATISPRMDIYGFGAVAFDDADGFTSPSSVTEPATSPYVLAVGAHCFADGTREDYSSVGPTIDGRIKPDISGPDGTSSPVYGTSTDCNGAGGFFGTSAAAPHAAGAAALVREANPALDASQVQEVLQSRAAEAGTAGKDNVFGSGLLRMGAVDTPDTPAPSKFTPLASPVRALDTRTSIGGHPGALAAASSYTLAIGGHSGVPADAKAVVLNLTVVNPSKGGYLSVYPSGSSSTVSNLNFVAGDVRANNATVTIGAADQSIVFFNGSSGPANIVADVVGYYGGTPVGGSTVNGYAPIVPGRILDTRTATGGHQVAMKPNETFDLPVTGGSVPSTATAVALNVTAVLPQAGGYLSLYPTGTTLPATSSLNFKAGQTTPNLVLAGVGTAGKVAIHVSATNGTLNLVVDVVGYYDPAAANGFVAMREPLRILDSRTGNSRLGALAGGTSLHLQVNGLYGVPSTATGAVMNTTVVAAVGGYLTVWPTGSSRPNASNLNFTAGQVVANNVMSGTGAGGQIDIFSSASTQVLADLAGYFRPFA